MAKREWSDNGLTPRKDGCLIDKYAMVRMVILREFLEKKRKTEISVARLLECPLANNSDLPKNNGTRRIDPTLVYHKISGFVSLAAIG